MIRYLEKGYESLKGLLVTQENKEGKEEPLGVTVLKSLGHAGCPSLVR